MGRLKEVAALMSFKRLQRCEMNKRLNLMFDGSGGKTMRDAARRLINLTALMIAMLFGGCMQKEDVVIPKEGDIVTWRHNSQLIIKTKLGQRREHVITPSREGIDHLIYEPEYERFIGQFPIDYVPERFPKFTEAERIAFEAEDANKKVHAIKSLHFTEFSLMLNGIKAKATDRSLYSDQALDDINQVKVQINAQGLSKGVNSTTKDAHERFLKSKEGRYDKRTSDEYDLDCYYETRVSSLGCFGKSTSPHISGVIISISSDGWVRGQSWESVYGGIHVEWRIHRQNLKHWKEVDAAIWRLLETWNVSPLGTYVKN